jgi:glyoxylase-like metal-dependent hydrolase (beta-lactamase superfamily II)
MNPKVIHFLIDVNESNSYVLIDSSQKKCILIDAGGYDPRISETVVASGLGFLGVFVTHNHYDHTDGLQETVKELGGQVYARNVRGSDVSVKDGDTIDVGGLKGVVLETPGHTSDSVSLLVGTAVFTGDCLFAGSVGGTSSIEDHQEELLSIASKILALPDDTRVYPGHGPATTVGIERAHNPFLLHL